MPVNALIKVGCVSVTVEVGDRLMDVSAHTGNACLSLWQYLHQYYHITP